MLGAERAMAVHGEEGLDAALGDARLTLATTSLPAVRGSLKADAPLGPLVWFQAGGVAQWLFEPKDADDLSDFLARSDEHTSELQSLMRNSYAVFCLKKTTQ